MNATIGTRGARRAGLTALAALGLAACTDYGIVTSIDPDGTGTRIETVRVTADEKSPEIPPERYLYLLGLGEENGWAHRTEVDDDTTHVFDRQRRIARPGDWDRLSGSVLVHGTTADQREERIGRTRLGDVEFSNVVSVRGFSANPGPGDTVTYRETFSWQEGAAAFVEVMATGILAKVAQEYPRINVEQRAEVAGVVRAGMWSAIEAGLLDPDSGVDDDALFESFVARTANLSASAMRSSYPAVRAPELAALIREDVGGILGGLIHDRLPGLDLAGSVSLELRLVPPGGVLETNAESVSGDTLVWNFDASDALAEPVEAVATFVIGPRGF